MGVFEAAANSYNGIIDVHQYRSITYSSSQLAGTCGGGADPGWNFPKSDVEG